MSNSVLYHTILLVNSTENHNIHIYCKQYLRRFNPFGLRSSQSIFLKKICGKTRALENGLMSGTILATYSKQF